MSSIAPKFELSTFSYSFLTTHPYKDSTCDTFLRILPFSLSDDVERMKITKDGIVMKNNYYDPSIMNNYPNNGTNNEIEIPRYIGMILWLSKYQDVPAGYDRNRWNAAAEKVATAIASEIAYGHRHREAHLTIKQAYTSVSPDAKCLYEHEVIDAKVLPSFIAYVDKMATMFMDNEKYSKFPILVGNTELSDREKAVKYMIGYLSDVSLRLEPTAESDHMASLLGYSTVTYGSSRIDILCSTLYLAYTIGKPLYKHDDFSEADKTNALKHMGAISDWVQHEADLPVLLVAFSYLCNACALYTDYSFGGVFSTKKSINKHRLSRHKAATMLQ